MTEQRSSTIGSRSPILYSEVRKENKTFKDQNIQTTEIVTIRGRSVSQEETIPEIESDDASMTSPPPTSVFLMQTPEQEQTCSRHLVVADSREQKKTTEKRKTPSSSSKPDQVFYTITSYDSAMEYKELDPKTLSRHYGEVTPYGTVAQSYVEIDGRTPSRASGTKSPNRLSGAKSPNRSSGAKSPKRSKSPKRHSSSSFSTSIYSSLLRTTDSGIQKLKLGERGIFYIDFLPSKKKERFCKKDEYLGFYDCVNQANAWFAENINTVPNRCESLRHRLDHSHKFNPESTAVHDRSYIIGLRVWYYLDTEERDLKLAYRDYVPLRVHPDDKQQTKAKNYLQFEDLPKTVKRINDAIKKNPINGYLLDVETLPMNGAQTHRSTGAIDPNSTYCCHDSQDKWELVIVRLFYIEDSSQQHSPNLGYKDFIPKPLTLPPSPVQFHTMNSLTSEANAWVNEQRHKLICAIENVDVSFKKERLRASITSVVNTDLTWRRTHKSSANQHSLKILRVWTIEASNSENGSQSGVQQPTLGGTNFDLVTFVPKQFTTSGCCGANKALFATSRDTVEKISDWMNRSGAEILDIQTDAVEKWQASSSDIHTFLPERTYNKEDYKNPALQSALECRLTVFRVYYRPTSLGHLYTPGPDNPAHPCCCFVGCTVM